VTLTVASQAFPAQFITAQITILAHIVVSVSPASANLAPATSQAFAANVLGTKDQTVAWNVTGAACGAAGSPCGVIDANGLYTAPISTPSPNAIQHRRHQFRGFDARRKFERLHHQCHNHHESLRILEPEAGNTDQIQAMNFIFALIKEARILGEDGRISLGRSEEAAAVFERAFKSADRLVHQDPNDQVTRGRLALAGLGLANILRHSDARSSLDIYDHTFGHMTEIRDNSSFRRFEVSALAGSTYPLAAPWAVAPKPGSV